MIPRMTEAQFTAFLLRELDQDVPFVRSARQTGAHEITLTYGPSDPALPDTGQQIIDPRSFYTRYLIAGNKHDALVDLMAIARRYSNPNVMDIVTMPYATAAPMLRVKLEAQSRNTSGRTHPNGTPLQCIERPWRDLVLTVCLDYPESVVAVQQHDVDRWAVPADDLFALGTANTRALALQTKPSWFPNKYGPDIAIVDDDHGYAATIAIFPDILQSWFPAYPELAVFIQRRDMLLVAPAIPETMLAMVDAIQATFQPLYTLYGVDGMAGIVNGAYDDRP